MKSFFLICCTKILSLRLHDGGLFVTFAHRSLGHAKIGFQRRLTFIGLQNAVMGVAEAEYKTPPDSVSGTDGAGCICCFYIVYGEIPGRRMRGSFMCETSAACLCCIMRAETFSLRCRTSSKAWSNHRIAAHRPQIDPRRPESFGAFLPGWIVLFDSGFAAFVRG